MAFEDFEYIYTPIDSSTYLQKGNHFVKSYGYNGEPHFDTVLNKYVRKYNHSLRSNINSYNYVNYYNNKIIIEKSFLKPAVLQNAGIMDTNGDIDRNKMFSIRMKVKISNQKKDMNPQSTSPNPYFRYIAGILLFSQPSPNILDYQTADDNSPSGIEKFTYPGSTVQTIIQDFPTYEQLTNLFSGYNLLLSSDERGVAGHISSKYSTLNPGDFFEIHPQKKHLSLYSYGLDTPLVSSGQIPDTVFDDISAANSDLWKLHEAEVLTGEQEYSLDTWYNIRLDYIPISTTSHKLVSYASKIGDIAWTKTGETIHNESDEKYVTSGGIGFIVGTITNGHLRKISYDSSGYYDVDTQTTYQNMYRIQTNTYIDNFEIYVQDI